MRNPLLIPELRELLAEGDREALRRLLDELHPNDAASILSGLEDQEIVDVMSLLPLTLERDLFIYFDPDVQESIVVGSGRDRVKALLTALPSDERAEFLEELDERVRAQLVPLLEKAARNDLARREQYPDDQVGSILSTEYCRLKRDLSADQAIAELRRQEPSRETIYYSYVTDDDGRLIGVVSLRDLLTARPTKKVEDIMRSDPVALHTTDDQEEAARRIREYDVLALPVVDQDHRLVGIFTYDDAADVAELEVTEDIERMAGIAGEAEADVFLDESVWSLMRRRVPLIAFLAIFSVVTASVIRGYEGALSGTLMGLLPMVMATGGMVGTQASSLVIRALTLGDIEPRRPFPVLWKELRVSLGMAAVLSAIVAAEAWLLEAVGGGEGAAALGRVCLAVAVAMAAHVTLAALCGASIPMLARLLRRDPAMVSTPAVTALADLSGAAIYLAVVTALVL